jgi:hypothetical protein
VKHSRPDITEALNYLLSRPILILTPTTYRGITLGGGGEVIKYCVKIYTYSLQTDTFEPILEACYSSVEEADKEFRKASKILKQKLGKLICVNNVDGDCFKLFKNNP